MKLYGLLFLLLIIIASGFFIFSGSLYSQQEQAIDTNVAGNKSIQSIVTEAPEKESAFDSIGADCKHCHGDKLQGVRHIKAKCGECHDLKAISLNDIQSQKITDAVTMEPHIHTRVKNFFSDTPSCFFCHRKTDFD